MGSPARRPFLGNRPVRLSSPLEVSPKPKRTLKAQYIVILGQCFRRAFPISESFYCSFRFVQEYACRAGAVHESTVGDGALSGKESVGVTCRRRPSLPSSVSLSKSGCSRSQNRPAVTLFFVVRCQTLSLSLSQPHHRQVKWPLDDRCYRKLQRRL